MKKIIIALSFILISNAHACFEQANEIFNDAMELRRHEQIYVHPEAKSLLADESHRMYGTVFHYGQDVLIYEGSSEFWSGFGVEAIVMNPKDCSLIEMVQVYAE